PIGFRCVAQINNIQRPSAYVYLEELPLSPNGKLDRKTLPAPENAHTESVTYVPPRTPAEESLCAIIADVLNVAKVGGNDNFFALGGDSILAIQVVSRARSAGLQLTPHDLFRAQTVAELALCAVEQVSQEEADAEEEGDIVPLTPIQRWFFTTQPEERHHFNQSVLLRPAGVIDPEAIRWALQELVSRHAALRLRFSADGQEQSVAPFAEVPLDVINLRNASETDWLRAVEEYCGKLQSCLDIATGPLMRACYFQGPDHAGNRLFLVCHHLAVDSVSWRILVDDLERLLRARSCGKEPELAPVTVSFPRWARELCALADSPDTLAEAEYWEHQLGASLALSLPGDTDAGAPFDVSGSLNEEETERLLHGIHESFHTGVQDILVAALTLTLARLDGLQEHSVMLESHGRGALDEYDLAHTVGWLTSLYPLRLTLPKGEDILALVKETKERLRRVPRQGIGYGLLRFVSEDAHALVLRSLPAAPVCFNYLGQINTDDASLFTLADEPVGLPTSPSRRPPYALEWNGAIRGGCLHFVVSCDPVRVTPDAACRFARAYEGAVREILTCCESDAVGGYTPSDFALANLDQNELDDLLSDINDDD
ncbi:MAG TPA: condensation domain-containing protein, partial [Armatimonadota bacterium]|nr:condensation domain-containing protein [Armatimonadota bacterium]